jgi:ESS family glutamate:Na+ symporter
MTGDPILVPEFETATLGLLVFLLGSQITRHVRILREFNIPEPVTGGLLAAILVLCAALLIGRPIAFGMGIRDYLLILFFAAIGLNARLADLVSGGRPLAILLGLTLALIVLQNLIGVAAALGFGLPAQAGLLMGSVSLIGGHGTAIAWAPEIGAQTGFAGAPELGVAAATLGLVIAALIGGPVARFLVERRHLAPADATAPSDLGLRDGTGAEPITPVDMMRTLFVLNVVILVGLGLHDLIGAAGLKLPAFVPCMLAAIVIGNLLPAVLPRYPAVSRSPALALVSDVALGTFLAISLMAMQLWMLAGLGAVLMATLLLQTAAVLAFILLLLFPLMGRTYTAAVLSAGVAGFSLGATPTAIANMNAVTKRYGPAPVAFVILPLVSAFFVDLANAAVIQIFLAF